MIFRSFIFRACVRHPSSSKRFERALVNNFNFHGSFEYQLKISRMSRLESAYRARRRSVCCSAAAVSINNNAYVYIKRIYGYYLFVNWSVSQIDTCVPACLPIRKHSCGERKSAIVTGQV